MAEYEVDSLLLKESTTIEDVPQSLIEASASFVTRQDAVPQLLDDMHRWA